MLKRLARLFTIKTRFEAALVIYAIATGAVIRGALFMAQYPGLLGKLMAVCCLGVVFIAGAKLFDSVRRGPPAIAMGPHRTVARHFRSPALRPRQRRRAGERATRFGAARTATRTT